MLLVFWAQGGDKDLCKNRSTTVLHVWKMSQNLHTFRSLLSSTLSKFSYAQIIMEKKKNLDNQSAHFTAGSQPPAKTLGFTFF